MSDAALVERARQGDAAAFGELVERHRSAVYRAARAALGSHADAEDAAQEAFVLAFRRLDSFRAKASFKTWLLTITWNQAINRRRSITGAWRRLVQPSPDDDGESPLARLASGGRSPEQSAADRELHHAVRDAIRSLPRTLRDVLLLAQSGEYTYEEIGAMLGAPVGTIKWRVSEARRRIKARLRDRGHDHVA